MTVGELIELLGDAPDDSYVLVSANGSDVDVESVAHRSDGAVVLFLEEP